MTQGQGKTFRNRLPAVDRICACWCFVVALLCPNVLILAAEPLHLPPLTSAQRNPRLPGKFVWVDLVTDDASAAQHFYADLFGWYFHQSGDYWIGDNQDRPMCGILQRPRPPERKATPRWFGYISV